MGEKDLETAVQTTCARNFTIKGSREIGCWLEAEVSSREEFLGWEACQLVNGNDLVREGEIYHVRAREITSKAMFSEQAKGQH